MQPFRIVRCTPLAMREHLCLQKRCLLDLLLKPLSERRSSNIPPPPLTVALLKQYFIRSCVHVKVNHPTLPQVPRGVIDLEPYTEIGVDQGTGAIVLGTAVGSDAGYRKFYFRPEDAIEHSRLLCGGAGGAEGGGEGEGGCGGGGGGGGMLGEWLSGLHRERFKVVRDERDAYMNLQVWVVVVLVYRSFQS